MGPRSCERGNGDEAAYAPARGKCFNGAALVRARKFRNASSSSCRTELLQWGRARASAEIALFRVARSRRRLASMGPRSCERGNFRPAIGKVKEAVFASMGPRSCERGNTHVPTLLVLASVAASMGPRSCERGNEIAHIRCNVAYAWLQWGRARASAEIAPGTAHHRTALVASMGPRSCERGNVKSCITSTCLRHRFNGAALVRARK